MIDGGWWMIDDGWCMMDDGWWMMDDTFLDSYIPTLLHSYIPTFLHSYIPTFPHSNIPTFLHSYIPTFLHFYIPTFLHSYIPIFLNSYIRQWEAGIWSCDLRANERPRKNMGRGQTDTHTRTHFNTVNRPGLRAGSIEKHSLFIEIAKWGFSK